MHGTPPTPATQDGGSPWKGTGCSPPLPQGAIVSPPFWEQSLILQRKPETRSRQTGPCTIPCCPCRATPRAPAPIAPGEGTPSRQPPASRQPALLHPLSPTTSFSVAQAWGKKKEKKEIGKSCPSAATPATGTKLCQCRTEGWERAGGREAQPYDGPSSPLPPLTPAQNRCPARLLLPQ